MPLDVPHPARWIPAAVLASVIALFTASCSRSTEAPPSGGGVTSVPGATGKAEGIVLAPNVVRMARSAVRPLLRSISTDGNVYVFDGPTGPLQALQAGQVLLVDDWMAVKVLAVLVEGSQVAVLTSPAQPSDVMQEGKLSFSAPLRFAPDGLRAESGGRPSLSLLPSAYAQVIAPDPTGPVFGTVTKKDDGWKHSVKATPEPNSLRITLSAEREVAGARIVIDVDARLEDFRVEGGLTVTGGQTDLVNLSAQKLKGTMNVSWLVTQQSASRELKNELVKFPPIVTVPLAPLVGGMPLSLEFSTGLLVKPAFSAANQISEAHFRVNFNGTQGFTVKRGIIDPDGNVTGDIELLKNRHVSPFAAMGMVMAVAAPRIDLVFGVSSLTRMDKFKLPATVADLLAPRLLEKIVPGSKLKDVLETRATAYFSLTTTTGMFKAGIASMLPCERHWLILTGNVGLSTNLMGLYKGDRNSTEIFRRKSERIEPDTRFCRSAG